MQKENITVVFKDSDKNPSVFLNDVKFTGFSDGFIHIHYLDDNGSKVIVLYNSDDIHSVINTYEE